MQQVDSPIQSWFIRILCLGYLFMFALPSLQAIQYDPALIEEEVCIGEHNGSKLIRVAGRMVERSSQRPLENAAVVISCGKLVLASKRANANGEFMFYIPLEKVSQATIQLRIQYLDHVFIKDELDPIDQEILVEVNEAVFSERQTFDDYKVPTHLLGQPSIGNVYIRS